MKKFFLVSIFFLFLFLSWVDFSFAQRPLETVYPDIPGTVIPTTVKTALPDYIVYIFNFAIIISGLIVFSSLLYGGIRWMISAGNPTALKEAKDQILASLFGLVVLFASYLILTTINPQLILLTATPEPLGGVTLYQDAGCSGVGLPITRSPQRLETDYNVQSISFLARANEMEIEFYETEDCSGQVLERQISQEKDCVNKSVSGARCVKMRWIPPGVYLCSEQYEGEVCQGNEIFIPQSAGTLATFGFGQSQDFNNTAQSIKFTETAGIKYGAVLHDEPGHKGACKIFTKEGEGEGIFPEGDLGTGEDKENFRNRASSITVFRLAEGYQEEDGPGQGVTFYDHEDHKGPDIGPFKKTYKTKDPKANPWITSMKMDPNQGYLVILFSEMELGGVQITNFCNVFNTTVPNFRKHPIGRCFCILGWGCQDCLSHYMILPIR